MSTLTASYRDMQVKPKKLRRMGFVPACIYGSQLSESLSIQIPKSDAEKLFRGKKTGSKVDIDIDGKKISVLFKELDRDAMKNEIQHMGFLALDSNTKVNSVANVELINRDKITGILEQSLFEIPYSAFPDDIVESITIDLECLQVGDRIELKDLALARNDRVQLLIPEDSLVLSVSENRKAPVSEEGGGEDASSMPQQVLRS